MLFGCFQESFIRHEADRLTVPENERVAIRLYLQHADRATLRILRMPPKPRIKKPCKMRTKFAFTGILRHHFRGVGWGDQDFFFR